MPRQFAIGSCEGLAEAPRVHPHQHDAAGRGLRIFDATFAITYGLEAIAIVVAVLGVTGTLVTLILERRRELAMLRLVVPISDRFGG